VNARERLTAFLRSAKKQLLIYDGALTDNKMIDVLRKRQEAGVDVRIIGKVEKGKHGLEAEAFVGKRQHLRCIVRDGRAVFLGSQSLRRTELDARREIGVIVRDAKVVAAIARIFDADWEKTPGGRKARKDAA
jgi:phosphatidylserine/phosphatidylglycerophosphate/cardiolipin synthase-like enzyme